MQTPQTTPSTPQPSPQITTPAASETPQDWRAVRQQQRIDHRARYHDAGIPVWGVLLIVIGAIALLGNFGLNLGWVFGLALGAWFIYLGVRHVNEGEDINWWLVGLGLLIGLGSISTGFADRLVFPVVLILVGIGILGQQYLRRPNP